MEGISKQALEGVKIIDLATAAAAPWIATFMADFGADVIKVEKPKEGDPIRGWGEQRDGIPLFWQAISRGKKSITLDLRKEKGKELLLELVKETDILIENFRPGKLESWGLAPEVLHEVNPRLIIMRVSGFGQYGPYSSKPGFGTLAEAMSGFAYTTGFPDGPPTLPALPLGDGITGIFGAFGVMVALYARDVQKMDKGQVLDLALYEPILRLLEGNTVDFDQLGLIRGRSGNRLPQTSPRNAYKTVDGEWIAISGSTPSTAIRVFKAIGQEHLLNDPRFKDNRARLKYAEDLDKIISEWVSQHTQKEAVQIFESFEVAVAPIYSVKDVFEDLHFNARETIIKIPSEELGEVALNNVIPKMSLTPGKIKSAAPSLGKHNQEVYKKIGLTDEQLSQLIEEGII
ncbi:CaiB/BaiF CoA-transferase family protein [Alkalihalobacillus sp. BA299]|uniref:CaiB/BaiF CoA transferase family protein n=1 Tax=Alkalihalobacillus sp. BA299 TaxID=2815938 RepID=UPI001ADD2A71|nr:CoA transferase [Alkalihalobacillus sp. BA299]